MDMSIAESPEAGEERPPLAHPDRGEEPHQERAEETAPLAHPDRDQLDLAAVLHALSDPMRLRIVRELAVHGGERTCKSFNLPIVKSTCTHHFKVLREAGLIRQRVVGTKRVSRLRREDLDVRFPGLLEAVVHGAEQSPGVFVSGE